MLEDVPPLAPAAGEIAYALAGLTLIERTAVTADLFDLHVRFRWEDDLVIVVPATAEDFVDRLLDEVVPDERDPGSSSVLT